MTSLEAFPLFRRAHNSYLELLAELGLFGFGLFIGAQLIGGVTIFYRLMKPAQQGKPYARLPFYLAISFASVSLMMLTLSIQEMFIVWVLCGACMIAGVRPQSSHSTKSKPSYV